MNKLIIDRDFISEQLSGMEFAVFLSAMDLGTIYRDKCVLHDTAIYYNLTGTMPSAKQRGEVNTALSSLIEGGHVVAEQIGRGAYIVDCRQSFYWELSTLPHGGARVLFSAVQKIVASGRGWQGMLRYYLALCSHMRKEGCAYSRQYFSDKLGISELTLSKYNTKLAEMGILSVVRRKDMPNIYRLTQ